MNYLERFESERNKTVESYFTLLRNRDFVFADIMWKHLKKIDRKIRKEERRLRRKK